MLAYVAEHGIGNVVVLFLDRFGRNPREILRRFWGLEESGTEVRSIKEDLREEMLLLVRAGVAGAESKRTGERVREALEKAAGRGRYVAKLPFGYVKVYEPVEKTAWSRPVASRVEQVPPEAAVVRLAFELATIHWTCCDYADALRERNGPEDLAKAMALLDESLAISSELGMRPLMERVLSRREILGA